MKYIRTIGGEILDLARFHEITEPIMKKMGYITLIDRLKTRDYEISVKDIIKQADTIEELCDEFVYHCHWTLDHREEHKSYKTLKELYADNYIIKSKYFVIYGAIWTDKGLIYVAKMNDKGELELL